MKLIQFILAILVTICAIGMLYGAITTYSPMKTFSITIRVSFLLDAFRL